MLCGLTTTHFQAGLFSAVLTAFNVQSYQLLQPAPTDDIASVLKQISTQLNSFSLSSSFANSTQQSQPLQDLQPPFRAPASAVWINALWFSSLVCSLASASIALMVKQWLHELAVGVSGQERESARRRQYRLNGLLKWHIGTVVVVIPIVLQVALFLFLAGLVILLWTLHSTVAAIASSLIGILFIFQSIVTVLPSVRWNCCYLSPQALMVYYLVRPVYNAIRALLVQASWSWARFESPTFWREDGSELNTFRATKKQIIAFCNQIKEMPAWRGQEQLAITSLVPARTLDREMALTACTTTSSLKHLEDMRALFSDLSPNEVVRYFEDTWALYEQRRAEGLASFHVHKSLNQLLLYALRHMLTVSVESRDAEWERLVKSIVDRHSLSPNQVAETDMLLTTMSVLAMNHSVSANLALSKVRHQISLRVSCSYSSIRNGTSALQASVLARLLSLTMITHTHSYDHGRWTNAAPSEHRCRPQRLALHIPPMRPDDRPLHPLHVLLRALSRHPRREPRSSARDPRTRENSPGQVRDLPPRATLGGRGGDHAGRVEADRAVPPLPLALAGAVCDPAADDARETGAQTRRG